MVVVIDSRALSLCTIAAVLMAACGSPDENRGSDGDASPIDSGSDPSPPDGAPEANPDLTLNEGRARIDLALRDAEFAENACELDPQEACVGAPGARRLLHFAVETPNVGDADMELGEPDPSNPNFSYSDCHGHYHFEGYAAYRLIDGEGDEIATGRKQAFCLLDVERYVTDDPDVARSPKYRCDFQGIQRGWADVYHTNLPCQFIDVTGVPDGAYTLEIELNADRNLVEKDYDNNLVSIPLDLASPDLNTPTEPCPEGIDDHSSAGDHRECGWQDAGTFTCVPGSFAHLGCASSPSCGATPCQGDGMMRVCDAEPTGANCSFPRALKSSDPDDLACPCALGVPCPPSGQLQVFTAPNHVGEPFTCDVQIIN